MARNTVETSKKNADGTTTVTRSTRGGESVRAGKQRAADTGGKLVNSQDRGGRTRPTS